MPKQTQTQIEEFQRICRENELDPRADVWQQQQSGNWIIGRTGIEKIQYKNNIAVSFEMVRCQPDYACVKAIATRVLEGKGASAKKLVTESFGSAIPGNCKSINYYAEMAEKRALSRAVLKNMGFYALGVYGEDEADDFKQPANTAATLPPNYGTPVPAEAPKKPVAEASAPVLAPLAVSTTSDQSIAGPVEIPAEVLAKYTRQIEAVGSGIDLKTLWDKLTKNEKAALFGVKEAAKVRLAEAAKLAQAEAARQAAGTMRVAGDDTVLVDEFEAQPVVPGRGPAVEYATGEQRQTIMRLLDHPTITRKEKTKLLLFINKLDKERARQALIKLREAIGEREGIDPRDGSRAQLKNLVTREGSKLTTDHADRLLALAADSEATLEALVDALTDAQNVLIDDETYGTDEELVAADQPAIAA